MFFLIPFDELLIDTTVSLRIAIENPKGGFAKAKNWSIVQSSGVEMTDISRTLGPFGNCGRLPGKSVKRLKLVLSITSSQFPSNC